MGSGKTRLGKKLAERMNLDFFDLDGEIERRKNLKISQIFLDKGETGFREIEKKTLHHIIEENDAFVLACGGGTPCFSNNMEQMNSAGKTLYLDVSEETLVNRLLNSKIKRPLIAGMNYGDLKNYVREKLLERKPYYSKAKIWVNPLETSFDTIVKSLLY